MHHGWDSGNGRAEARPYIFDYICGHVFEYVFGAARLGR
jgi:hypothetical protein